MALSSTPNTRLISAAEVLGSLARTLRSDEGVPAFVSAPRGALALDVEGLSHVHDQPVSAPVYARRRRGRAAFRDTSVDVAVAGVVLIRASRHARSDGTVSVGVARRWIRGASFTRRPC